MNGENLHITEELLTRYLLKETDAAENISVEEWLKAAPENRKQLLKLKTLLDMYALAHQDIDEAWHTFKEKLPSRTKEIAISPQKQKFNYRLWAIAASLAMIIGFAAYFVFFADKKEPYLIAHAVENVLELALNDGSNITLNRNSTLEYPAKFTQDNRHVKLRGEAFFEVASIPEQPFVVEAHDLIVKVLGTSFYIKAHSPRHQQVYVQTGKVECEHKRTGEHVILNAGEKFEFGIDKEHIEAISSDDMNSFAWKTARLVFVNESMNNIAYHINKAYGCNIKLSGHIINCRLTVSIEDLTLEGVLNVLQSILPIHVEQSGREIKISGDGC